MHLIPALDINVLLRTLSAAKLLLLPFAPIEYAHTHLKRNGEQVSCCELASGITLPNPPTTALLLQAARMYFSDDIKCAGCAQYLLLPFLTLTTLCRRNTFGLVASPGPIKLHRICFLRLPALLHCLLLSISEMLYSGQNSLSLSHYHHQSLPFFLHILVMWW